MEELSLNKKYINMKVIKKIIIISTLLVAMSSCDDDISEVITSGKDGIITSQEDPDLDAAYLTSEITGEVTLNAENEWKLAGPLIVKSGATLTIEAGTTIKAVPGGTNIFISVEQGAQIFVQGTAKNPVVMTSAAASPKAGDWGGLIIAGNAPVNTGVPTEAELFRLTYGGNQPADDSGTITYLKIEYTGARINEETEFNGLSLYGVGNGTTINHLVVANGADDGIDLFGGTVNLSNILVVNSEDDMFDWTDGWTGTANNLYGARLEGFEKVTSDSHGIEGDNQEAVNNDTAMPRSNPTITGLTIVNAANVKMEDLINIRRGSSVTISNALLVLTGGATTGNVVDLTDRKGNADVSTSITANVLGADEDTVNNPDEATVTLTEVAEATGGADATVFEWTGISLPIN